MTRNLCIDDRSELFEAAGGQTLGAGPTTITFDTVARSDTGFITTPSGIIIPDAGRYDLRCFVSIGGNSNSRTTYRTDLLVDAIVVASGFSYHRTGALNNIDTVTLFRDVQINSGQTVSIQATRIQGTTNGTIQANGACFRATRA